VHRASGAHVRVQKSMSTSAQVANQANAQFSTGPKSQAGKAAAARNHFCHGLSTSSEFWVLPSESHLTAPNGASHRLNE